MKDNFIIHNSYKRWQLFVGIDSSGFKATHASQYYAERIKLTAVRRYIKPSLTDDVVQQIICTIKIRRAPTGHISYFQPLITKTSEILPLSVVIGDKGYDSQDNLILVRDVVYVFSVIPARCVHVPIRRTCERYTKQMNHGYSKLLYGQREAETIVSVIKRLFGEHIT